VGLLFKTYPFDSKRFEMSTVLLAGLSVVFPVEKGYSPDSNFRTPKTKG